MGSSSIDLTASVKKAPRQLFYLISVIAMVSWVGCTDKEGSETATADAEVSASPTVTDEVAPTPTSSVPVANAPTTDNPISSNPIPPSVDERDQHKTRVSIFFEGGSGGEILKSTNFQVTRAALGGATETKPATSTNFRVNGGVFYGN